MPLSDLPERERHRRMRMARCLDTYRVDRKERVDGMPFRDLNDCYSDRDDITIDEDGWHVCKICGRAGSPKEGLRVPHAFPEGGMKLKAPAQLDLFDGCS